MPKGDNTTKQRRLEAVKLLNEGKSYGDIAVILSKKYGVTERQGYRYVESAIRLMSKVVEQQLENMFSELSSKFLFLYDKAIELEDYKLALAVIRDYVKSFGLQVYTPMPTGDTMANKIDKIVFVLDDESEQDDSN